MKQPGAASPIVYVRFLPRDRMPLMVATLMFGAAALALLTLDFETEDKSVHVVGTLFGLIALTALTCFVLRTRQRWRLARRLRAPAAGHVRRRRVVEALVNLRRLERRFTVLRRFPWHFQRAKRSLQAHGIDAALTVIDAKLQSAVHRVNLVHELLECEEVGESMRQASSWRILAVATIILIAGIVIARLGFGGGWMLLVVILITFALVSTAFHRWLVASQGTLARMRGLAVGLGFVADHHHAWIATQTLTILRYEAGKILITIMDDFGVVRLQYLLSPSTGFEEFWKRWMHPHPRPELAGDFVRQVAGEN